MAAWNAVTPAYVFETHTLNACNDLGDICNECLERWPCHAFLVASYADEALKESAALVADLVAQRDALLEQINP